MNDWFLIIVCVAALGLLIFRQAVKYKQYKEENRVNDFFKELLFMLLRMAVILAVLFLISFLTGTH